mgnify:CR=1 FL=1
MSEFIIAKALKYPQPKEEKIVNTETIPWSMVAKGLPITLILMHENLNRQIFVNK